MKIPFTMLTESVDQESRQRLLLPHGIWALRSEVLRGCGGLWLGLNHLEVSSFT